MKILIAVDIEGIAGITNSREYNHFEFGREWCTLDTNAAIEGALAGGAMEDDFRQVADRYEEWRYSQLAAHHSVRVWQM